MHKLPNKMVVIDQTTRLDRHGLLEIQNRRDEMNSTWEGEGEEEGYDIVSTFSFQEQNITFIYMNLRLLWLQFK